MIESYSFSVSEVEYPILQKLCPSDFPFDYKTFAQREKEGIASMLTQGMRVIPVRVSVNDFMEWCKKTNVQPNNTSRCKYAIMVGKQLE